MLSADETRRTTTHTDVWYATRVLTQDREQVLTQGGPVGGSLEQALATVAALAEDDARHGFIREIVRIEKMVTTTEHVVEA